MINKIYLSPSNQNGNAFCTGGVSELDVWYDVAGRLKPLLEKQGFSVAIAPKSKTLKARADEAAAWGADIYAALHSNASAAHKARGAEVWYDSSRADAPACKALASAFLKELGSLFRSNGLKTSHTFWDCYYPKMPSCIVECGFHDNPEDARLILDNRQKIAEKYCAALTGLRGAGTAAPETEKAETVCYTVKKGDTLSAVARRFGTTVSALAKANEIINPDLILVGQKIILPDAKTYTVKKGDTLGAIARANGTTVARLVRANKIANADLIITGQRLTLV